MKKLTAALLLASLALTACGGGTSAPAPAADLADDTDDGAKTTASLTLNMTAGQAVQSLGLRALASAPPTSPVSVTLAVKVGTAGSRYAGQRRAFLGWKLNGKTFPAELTGTTSGTYTLALTDAASVALKFKTGTVSATLPLASGNMNTSRSRSTAYVDTSALGGVCASAFFSLALPNGSTFAQGSEAAPLTVCESGVVPPAPAPAPITTNLNSVTVGAWFGDWRGEGVNAFRRFYNVPSGTTVGTEYLFRDAEECGAGDRYGSYESGSWIDADPYQPGRYFRVPVDVQAMSGGVGLAFKFVLTLGAEVKTIEGVSCYNPGAASPN